MKKTIRFLTIISTALVVLSLLILLISIPLQSLIGKYVLGISEQTSSQLPMFPLIQFLECLACSACVALMFICCFNKKGGIVIEIIIIGCLVILFPFVFNVLSRIYTEVLLTHYPAYRLVAYSTVSQISSYCLTPLNWGSALACVTAGMSIASKKLEKEN